MATDSYTAVLPRAQKLFSLKSAIRNASGTLQYQFFPPVLPASDRVTLFTCNIFPPLVTLWNHLVQKLYGDQVDVFVFDCSGRIDPRLLPGTTVQKYMNAMHPTKIDQFIQKSGKNRDIIWICDDDVFPVSPDGIRILKDAFAQDRTATVSFRPRRRWHFDIDDNYHEVSGSYCIALDRRIFVDTEHLNAQPCDGNTHPSHTEKPMSRYDTLDKANETLLQKGYRCFVVDEQKRNACFAGYDGTSIGALLLDYFKAPEDIIAYFDATEDEQWGGNVLRRNLGSLIAIDDILQMYTQITGESYAVPTLPARSELNRIRDRAEPHLAEGWSFTEIDATTAALQTIL